MSFPIALISVPVTQAGHDCHEDNPNVEHKAPILDVVEIVLYSLLNGSVASIAINLRPSCNTNFQAVSIVVPGDISEKLLNEVWSFRSRSNNAHVAD